MFLSSSGEGLPLVTSPMRLPSVVNGVSVPRDAASRHEEADKGFVHAFVTRSQQRFARDIAAPVRVDEARQPRFRMG